MRILDTTIPLNSVRTLDLQVAKLYTRTQVEIPVVVHRGKKEGPAILLLAGVHGDEVCGIDAVRRILIELKERKLTKGTVIAIPVFNVFGFLALERALPDGRDLNRFFPGTPNGSLASRLAHALVTEILPHVDVVIDLHSGSAQRYNYPHLRATKGDARSIALANAFDPHIIMMAAIRKRSIREYMNGQEKAYLLFEGGMAKELSEDAIREAIRGITRVMQHMGLWTGALDATRGPVELSSSKWIRASAAGLFHPLVPNGSAIEKGMVIGLISDPYGGAMRRMKAPYAGHVICVNTAPVVNQGDALVHIGMR